MAHLPLGAPFRKNEATKALFTGWGAPEELSTDGGTNLLSGEMAAFLRRWGVTTRLSSAQCQQSNGQAEAAVKTAKTILRDNMGTSGSLDTLQQDGNMFPAKLTTGRQLPSTTTGSIMSGSGPWKRGRLRWSNVTRKYYTGSTVEGATCSQVLVFEFKTRPPKDGASLVPSSGSIYTISSIQ